MSRDAKFMEDIIESGRCDRQNSRIVVYDADELVDDDSPQLVKLITRMKNKSRAKKWSLAASGTKRLNRSKKLLQFRRQDDTVHTNHWKNVCYGTRF